MRLGSRDGAVVRALASHQRGPGSNPGSNPVATSYVRRHMWVEFCCWFSSLLEGFSLGTPVFLPLQKPPFPNSNSNQFYFEWTVIKERE